MRGTHLSRLRAGGEGLLFFLVVVLRGWRACLRGCLLSALFSPGRADRALGTRAVFRVRAASVVCSGFAGFSVELACCAEAWCVGWCGLHAYAPGVFRAGL